MYSEDWPKKAQKTQNCFSGVMLESHTRPVIEVGEIIKDCDFGPSSFEEVAATN